jgi:hypothetical protein
MTSILGKLGEYGMDQIKRGRKTADKLVLRAQSQAKTFSPAFASRRQLARCIDANPWHNLIPQKAGISRFGPNTFPGTAQVVKACEEILAARHEDFARLREKSGKRYLVNILNEVDFEKFPELVDFALSQPLVSAVSSYLGYLPRLGTIDLLVSTPGPVIKGSQWLHTDAGDPDNVKCFINITNVATNNGPLHVLPKRESMKFRRKVWNVSGSGKYADAKYEQHINPNDFVLNTGAPGSGVIADTSKCFHYGGRVETGQRAMLVVHFSRFSFGRGNLPTESQRTAWDTSPQRHALLTLDHT